MAMWELHDGKQQVGPLEEEHVIRMIAAGLPEATMIRPAGAENWKSIRAHAPFAIALEQAVAAGPGGAAPPPQAPGYPPPAHGQPYGRPPAQGQGYGPPAGHVGQGYPPAGPGYHAQAYGPPAQQPPKKGLSTAALIAIIGGVVVMGPCALCVFTGAISSVSKTSREEASAPNVTSPGPTSVAARPTEHPTQKQPAAKGAPEPPPPSAAKASEVSSLVAKLEADKAYQGIWAPPRRADLKVLLMAVSQLLASTTTAGAGRMTMASSDALKARKLVDATTTLYMVLARQGAFPGDFTRNLNELLASSKSEPNLGVWAPAKATAAFDYAALAAWLNRESPDYLRALLAAKKQGPVGWPDPKDALRPWLASEKEALKALANLDSLFVPERDRLTELLSSRYGDANVERVQIETLLSEYKGNEVRADTAYKGKVIETTGIVNTVKKDITDSIYVILGSGAQFEIPEVQCFFDDRLAKKAAALNKGDRVTVRGTVSGLMMNVLVKDCEFVD